MRVICPNVATTPLLAIQNKFSYECKQYHHRQSLRLGTVMGNSKLPFMYLYIAMHLLTSTKKSFSGAELTRQ